MERGVRSWPVAVALALIGGLAWAVTQPPTADLAAQTYRVWLARTHGVVIWDNAWFGGHHVPGYSIVSPLAGAVVGLPALGVVSAVVSTWAFGDIVRRVWPSAPASPVLWVATASVSDLVIGRVTYAMGVTFGLLAVRQLVRAAPPWRVGLLAVVCAATSPIAGVFVMVAGAASLGRVARGATAAMLAAPAAMIAVLVFVFPEGGRQPYPLVAALVAGCAGLGVAAAARCHPVVRRGAILYCVLVAGSTALPLPMGSNASRLGVSFALPLMILVRRDGDRRLARGAVLLSTAWLAWAPSTELAKVVATPYHGASHFTPLVAELTRRHAERGRVEVVPSATRWESVYVARRFALARGWETQLDVRYNRLFYTGGLDSTAYRLWLRRTAVRFVALDDGPRERWGRREARLILAGLPYLREVWRGGGWRLYAVENPRPVVARARAIMLRSQELRFVAQGPTTSVASLRWTRWWSVSGPACVRRAPGGETMIDVRARGLVVLRAALRFPAPRRCGGR